MERDIPTAARSLLGCRNAAGLRRRGLDRHTAEQLQPENGSSGDTSGLLNVQGAASLTAEGCGVCKCD